jgi:hypothetical protein
MNKCVSLMNGAPIQEFLNGVKWTVQEKHFWLQSDAAKSSGISERLHKPQHASRRHPQALVMSLVIKDMTVYVLFNNVMV